MKDKKKLTYGILIFSFLTLIVFPIYVAAQSFDHPGDHDEPTLVSRLINKEIVWQVVNASGVYHKTLPGYEDSIDNGSVYRVGAYIKYDVLDLDYENELYDVDISAKYYISNDFVDLGENKSDFLLVSRNWGESMVKYIVEENNAFWGDQQNIDQAYDSSYTTTWWEFNFINTFTVTFKMNDTDYEELVYTRAEGILLSRTAVVGGGERGYLRIELVSYSGSLELSPWFYVIIGGSFFGIVVLSLMLGSFESQRKKLMRIREEEIKGRFYLGSVLGLLLTIYGLMNIVNVSSVVISATQVETFFMIIPVHFLFAFCGILLICLMSIKDDRYRYSGIATGTGVSLFGLLIMIDYFMVYAQTMMVAYYGADQVYFTFFGYIPGWSYFLMFPVGIVLFILGIFISTTLSLKEGRDSIFLKAACPIIIVFGIFCFVDYAFNVISNYEVDLTPIIHWSPYVSSFLAVGCIFLIPLISFLVFIKKR